MLNRYRLLALLLATLSLPAVANEAVIRKSFAERMPNAPKIDEVRPAPVPGLWEVRIGNEIRYTDPTGTYLIEGEVFDLKAKKNLTEERVTQVNRIDFATLPFKDAVTWKNGTGKRRIAVFADPNCGYCKRFEKGLQEMKDVTVYTFHPHPRWRLAREDQGHLVLQGQRERLAVVDAQGRAAGQAGGHLRRCRHRAQPRAVAQDPRERHARHRAGRRQPHPRSRRPGGAGEAPASPGRTGRQVLIR